MCRCASKVCRCASRCVGVHQGMEVCIKVCRCASRCVDVHPRCVGVHPRCAGVHPRCVGVHSRYFLDVTQGRGTRGWAHGSWVHGRCRDTRDGYLARGVGVGRRGWVHCGYTHTSANRKRAQHLYTAFPAKFPLDTCTLHFLQNSHLSASRCLWMS